MSSRLGADDLPNPNEYVLVATGGEGHRFHTEDGCASVARLDMEPIAKTVARRLGYDECNRCYDDFRSKSPKVTDDELRDALEAAIEDGDTLLGGNLVPADTVADRVDLARSTVPSRLNDLDDVVRGKGLSSDGPAVGWGFNSDDDGGRGWPTP